MAYVKIRYTVQSCPVCHKKLLKVTTGSTIIGSPLITCKSCGRTYRTDLREEWFQYEAKWMLWGMPLIITGVSGIVGLLMGEPAIAIMVAFIGLLIGLGFTIKDVIRMLMSKKRMRSAEYVTQLLLYGVITPGEYKDLIAHTDSKDKN